jgi:tRNA G18 (ribose-2'-O)-methylase SpoU
MNQALEDSWREGGKTPNDPGLRETYATLPRAPIRLIVLPLGKAINHGGMTRIADAYRIERVDFSKELDGAVDFAAQRGTKGWQPWRWIDSATAIHEAKSEGYTVAALTLSDRAVDVAAVKWNFPLAIVLGEEAQGIPSDIEALCDISIAIPLYGLVTSMNVVTASAISLEYAVRQYARDHPDFTPARAASRDLLVP